MKPNKTYGQNFLKSTGVANQIVEAADLNGNNIVLEIGPGKGILTEKLLGIAREVIAVEKDERLVLYLQFKFKNEIAAGKLKFINEDILEFNPEDYRLQAGGYKLVANIPYYITGEILRRFLSVVAAPSKMVLMVQKEVADRIMARPKASSPLGQGKESILSISVKAYGEPHYIQKVDAKMFSPTPKVDSAIIVIENISKKFFGDIDEKKFFALVKKGFSSKRKMVLNNLMGKGKDAAAKATFAAAFSACGISETARAENLTLRQWKCLAKFGEGTSY